MVFWQVNMEVPPLKFTRLVCVTGRSAYDRTDIVQVDVDLSGIRTSKETFSYLVSILQTCSFLLIFPSCFVFLPMFFSCTFLFVVPHLESLPKCVSWVITDAFCGSEDCKCVGIFKGLSALQLSAIVILHWCQQKQICWLLECPFALLWIHHWSGRAGQHCVNEPQPTQSPIGFRAFSQWKYPCKTVSFCL